MRHILGATLPCTGLDKADDADRDCADREALRSMLPGPLADKVCAVFSGEVLLVWCVVCGVWG